MHFCWGCRSLVGPWVKPEDDEVEGRSVWPRAFAYTSRICTIGKQKGPPKRAFLKPMKRQVSPGGPSCAC